MIHVGKLGIMRLTGPDLAKLRRDCWERDKGRCQECGVLTYWGPRFAGDPLAYDMAHIKSRGAGGSDVLENVRTLCHAEHMREHSGATGRRGPAAARWRDAAEPRP
jgi:5-methylcytosine-specific restriction endonuclease McrA